MKRSIVSVVVCFISLGVNAAKEKQNTVNYSVIENEKVLETFNECAGAGSSCKIYVLATGEIYYVSGNGFGSPAITAVGRVDMKVLNLAIGEYDFVKATQSVSEDRWEACGLDAKGQIDAGKEYWDVRLWVKKNNTMEPVLGPECYLNRFPAEFIYSIYQAVRLKTVAAFSVENLAIQQK